MREATQNDSPETGQLSRRAARAAVALALILVLAKSVAWMKSGSLSLFSSLVDSFLDSIVSLANLGALYYAHRPADRDHPFGHNSIEDIAGVIQAAFIAGSAVYILLEALNRLSSPVEMQNGNFAIGVMVLSMILTAALLAYQRFVIHKTQSPVIKADALHYMSDMLMNAGILVALALSTWFGMIYADPIIALLVALYILYGAWQVGSAGYHNLMDRGMERGEIERIRKVVTSHPGVEGVHGIKTRFAGTRCFIQYHLELKGGLTLLEAHEVTDKVEQKVADAFPGSEVLSHMDPVEILPDADGDAREHDPL